MTPDQMKELAARLRERNAPIDRLEAADLIEQMAQANLPISEVRAAADLIEKTKQLCACGDRPKADCPGEWEQGCDLGANEKFVAQAQRVPLTDEQIAEIADAPNVEPLIALLEYADISDGTGHGTIATYVVRDLVNQALAPQPGDSNER